MFSDHSVLYTVSLYIYLQWLWLCRFHAKDLCTTKQFQWRYSTGKIICSKPAARCLSQRARGISLCHLALVHGTYTAYIYTTSFVYKGTKQSNRRRHGLTWTRPLPAITASVDACQERGGGHSISRTGHRHVAVYWPSTIRLISWDYESYFFVNAVIPEIWTCRWG